MERFDDSRFYATSDPELEVFGSAGTLAQWRHKGVGPGYVRFGNRILYEGAELNRYIDEHRVVPAQERDKRRRERDDQSSVV